jgi:hypothetical protein
MAKKKTDGDKSEGREAFVPYPETPAARGAAAFARDLHAKLEMRPVSSRETCRGSPADVAESPDGRAKFDLHPVQQFVTAFLSPLTPYRSLLMFHGTGVGKTCTAVNIAESFASTGKQPILVVPQSISGQFRKTMYDVRKVPADDDGALDLRKSARAQCTGSKYVLDDPVGSKPDLTRAYLWLSLQQKLGKRFRIMGHDVLGNQVEAVRERVAAEFTDVTESVRERELTSVMRSIYDNRVIVVDEAHDMVPRGGTKVRSGYDGLVEIVTRCRNVRLVLMTATPMFDRASEIVPLLNLILANEKEGPLPVEEVVDRAGTVSEALTERGRAALMAAALGRVSFATGDDPRSFPLTLSAAEAGVRGAGMRDPPRLDYLGNRIRDAESWAVVLSANHAGDTDDPGRVVAAELSPAQVSAVMSAAAGDASKDGTDAGAGGGASMSDTLMRQACNVVFDPGLGDFTGEAQFRSAFRVNMSSSSGMQVVPRGAGEEPNALSRGRIRACSPKFANVVDSVVAASAKGHLCFVYSSYVWSGVLPIAVALEARGIMPAKGRPLTAEGQKGGARDAREPRGGKYVIISKHPSLDPTWGVTDKVAAVNAPGSAITVVLGTEMSSQGLDFVGIREVHIVEPWYNSSRTHQVVGRAVRRCSHAHLPPEERNVTVHYHAARFGAKGGAERETVDLKSLRFSMLKRRAVTDVERLLRDASLDCDLYHRGKAAAGKGGKATDPDAGGGAWASVAVASNGARVDAGALRGRRRDLQDRVQTCAMPWRFQDDAKVDRSTFQPYAWAHRTDMTAWDIAHLLTRNRAMTYAEVAAGLGPEQTDLSISLALDLLIDPMRGSKYLAPDKVVFVSGTYALIPGGMNERKFTLREARERRVYGAPTASAGNMLNPAAL